MSKKGQQARERQCTSCTSKGTVGAGKIHIEQSDSIRSCYLIGINKRTFLLPFPAELNKRKDKKSSVNSATFLSLLFCFSFSFLLFPCAHKEGTIIYC